MIAAITLISQKTKLAIAIRSALSRWEGRTRFVPNGRIELDDNITNGALWYSWVGSNHRPPDPQTGALTN